MTPSIRPDFIRPDFDPELSVLLGDAVTAEDLARLNDVAPPVEVLLEGRSVSHRDVTIEMSDGAQIPLAVFTPTGVGDGEGATGLPCVYWVHGGGMVAGDRFWQIDIPLEWTDHLGGVIVSVDYRLAPAVRGATPVEDCYRGLRWVVEHAAELGVDPGRIIVAGSSAGGGLAAGTALLARDRGGPSIAAQVLIYPMLDHRNATTSSKQYAGMEGAFSTEVIVCCWQALLGDLTDDQVTGYISPTRADDLSGLPPTYIDVGSAEIFRDEAIEYASRIWAVGGRAELKVWEGGFHGFDEIFPHAAVSVSARDSRIEWLRRLFTGNDANSGRDRT
ncbi:alpha/beta hydrolase [Streptomyces sp. NPDC059396]|uniref:alpha/beta hydrolase n=1 Tax=Streptomyces sp. NPDC059396 TaxID=3346819 RepID=UPI0036CFB98F